MDNKRSIVLKELAKQTSKKAPMTSDEAFDMMLDGIRQHYLLAFRTIDWLIDIQDEWPMPTKGWELFTSDVEKFLERFDEQ